MDFEIGIVCGTCDGFNAFGTPACVLCHTPLQVSASSSAALTRADRGADGGGAETGASDEAAAPADSVPPATIADLHFESSLGPQPSHPSLPVESSRGAMTAPVPADPAYVDSPVVSALPAISEVSILEASSGQPPPMPLGIPSGHPVPRVDAGSAALFSEALRLRRSTPGATLAPKMDRAVPFFAANSAPPASSASPPAGASSDRPSQQSPSSPSASRPVAASPRVSASIPRPEPGVRPTTATRAPQSAFPPPSGRALSLEELMEQAKNFICRSCSTPVPLGHKFCGRCGAAVPPEVLAARTQFFGQLQAPGKAKLILIRGEGVEGLSYQLNAEQHIVGRNGQLVFPDDPFVSPRHANLFYRNQKLVVRDEGSVNGVFLRVRGTIEVLAGDHFLAGEQLFRLDATPKFNDGPAPDGTYFYSSPKHQTPFRVSQILQGGLPGMVVCARSAGIQIGREGGDMNFPGDLYMSASHCKIDEAGGKFSMTDLNSRNGTYVRLKGERELAHGDYLFIGKKLLRVEITAA